MCTSNQTEPAPTLFARKLNGCANSFGRRLYGRRPSSFPNGRAMACRFPIESVLRPVGIRQPLLCRRFHQLVFD